MNGGREEKRIRMGTEERRGGEQGRREGEPEASERGNARLDFSDRRREGVRLSSLSYFVRPGCFFSNSY